MLEDLLVVLGGVLILTPAVLILLNNRRIRGGVNLVARSFARALDAKTDEINRRSDLGTAYRMGFHDGAQSVGEKR